MLTQLYIQRVKRGVSFNISVIIYCYFCEVCRRLLQLFGPLRLLSRVLIKVTEDVYVNLRFMVVMNVCMRMGVVMMNVMMNFT